MTAVGQKHILYIVTQGNFGGAQKYVFDMSIAFKAQGYKVSVAAGNSGNILGQKLQKGNVDFYRIKNLVRQINPVLDIIGFFETLKLIRKLKPNIVHLNSSKAGTLGALAAKIAGVPKVIFTVHGLVLKEPLSKLSWWFRYISHKFAGIFTDIFIAVSKADAVECIRLGLKDRQHVLTIPISIDLHKLEFFNREQARNALQNLLPLPEGEIKRGWEHTSFIGTVADYYPAKGLEYLITAAKIVAAKNPKVKFLLIGRDGPLKEKIPALIQKKGLEDIVFTLSLQDAWQFLKSFDLFVLPSVKEGLPYTILEAFAAGLPIVATNVGGIPDVITDRVSGLLVGPANSQALAEAINELLGNPELSRKLGEQAKLDVQKFSLDKMVEETKRVYSE